MIPDWKLERYLTGDLPESEMREILELEKKDEVFAQRVKLMREDNAAILRKMPFERLSEKLDAMPERSNSAGNTVHVNFRLVKFAAAAAFVLAVVSVALFSQKEIIPSVAEQGAGTDVAMLEDAGNGTRIKGMDARMEVWKKTSTGIVQLNDLDEVAEGDEIQLRYAVPEKCFGLLFSMDGNGALTLHMGNGEKAIELAPGKMNSLPFAYKLDDAPYFEKFFFVTSSNEFSVEEKDVDKLLNRSDVKVIGFTLKKVGK